MSLMYLLQGKIPQVGVNTFSEDGWHVNPSHLEETVNIHWRVKGHQIWVNTFSEDDKLCFIE